MDWILQILTLFVTNCLTLFLTLRSVQKRERAIADKAIEEARQAAEQTERQKMENLVEKLKTYNIYIEDLDAKATGMIKKYNELQKKYDDMESNYNALSDKYDELERKYNNLLKKSQKKQ